MTGERPKGSPVLVREVLRVLFCQKSDYLAVLDQGGTRVEALLDKDLLMSRLEQEGEDAPFLLARVPIDEERRKLILGKLVVDDRVKSLPVFRSDGSFVGLWPKGKVLSSVGSPQGDVPSDSPLLEAISLMPMPLALVGLDGSVRMNRALISLLGGDPAAEEAGPLLAKGDPIFELYGRSFCAEAYEVEEGRLVLVQDVTESISSLKDMVLLAKAFEVLFSEMVADGRKVAVVDEGGRAVRGQFWAQSESDASFELFHEGRRIGRVFLSSPSSEVFPVNSQVTTLKELLRDTEREAIVEALSSTGSISGAAKLLGIPRQTLQYRMKRLGISFERDD